MKSNSSKSTHVSSNAHKWAIEQEKLGEQTEHTQGLSEYRIDAAEQGFVAGWNAALHEGLSLSQQNQIAAEVFALRDGVTKILNKWDDGENNYRGKVILGELRKVLIKAETAHKEAHRSSWLSKEEMS